MARLMISSQAFLFLIRLAWASESIIQPGWQNFTINANGQETSIRYPLGLDLAGLRGIASELADKFQLDMGYGCSDRNCLVDALATYLAKQEPKSLDEWLYKSGWKSDQVAVLHDVMNINYWHYAMLNDDDRNMKFDRAIAGAVHRAKSRRQSLKRANSANNTTHTIDDVGVDPVCVVDLGSGSGLLAMMAARAGADMVHAVEQSALLSAVGPGIMRRNEFRVKVNGQGDGEWWSDPWPFQIQWLHRKSTDVSLQDLSFESASGRNEPKKSSGRCDVLVSETLGVSVLDEAGLGFMADARDRLILPVPRVPPASHSSQTDREAPLSEVGLTGEVVPVRVMTKAAVIRCPSLHALSFVSTAAGFELGSGMNGFRDTKTRLRRMSKDWGFMLSEAQHEVVAGPFHVLTVDFSSDTADAYDGGVTVTSSLPVSSAGEVHAVVSWFEADLGADVDGIPQHLSTSPWAPDNSFARQQHWGQLIQLLPLVNDEHGAGDDVADDPQKHTEAEQESTRAAQPPPFPDMGRQGQRGRGGRPMVVKETDQIELTSFVSSTGGGGSIFFPSVRVLPGHD